MDALLKKLEIKVDTLNDGESEGSRETPTVEEQSKHREIPTSEE